MPEHDGVRWDRLPLRSRQAEARTLDAVHGPASRALAQSLEDTLAAKRLAKSTRGNASAVNVKTADRRRFTAGYKEHYARRIAEAEGAERTAAERMTKLTRLPEDQAEARLAAWQNTSYYTKQEMAYPPSAEEAEAQYLWQKSSHSEPDPFDKYMRDRDPRVDKALNDKVAKDSREVRTMAAQAVMGRRMREAMDQRRTQAREQAPASSSIAQAASARSRGQADGPSTGSRHSSSNHTSAANSARPAKSHFTSVHMPWSKQSKPKTRR